MPTKTKPAVAEVPLPPAWVEEVQTDPIAEEQHDMAVQYADAEDEVIRAIVPAEQVPPTHHLVVGMGTLAAMSEEEFTAKLDVMKRGQARLRTIQSELLTKGEDYGLVKGIDKPFLHQPGAEKLANFYGLAVEQFAERLVGDGVTSPPLAYHVRSLVHLGDFAGPVVAQGFGESSSWEEKNRYRWSKPACPKCGREGLVRGKKASPLAGRWWCPGRDGGCNSKFEPNATKEDGSLLVEPAHRIDNEDPWSLAETILLMASKRSMVSAVRRATGTSGLFTQDPDSPSVQAQVGDDNSSTGITSEPAPAGITVGVGAKTTEATQAQHAELKRLAAAKGLNGIKIADLLTRLFGVEVEPTGAAASTAVRGLDAEQVGRLIAAISTGEVPEESDEVARAMLPDDIGAK